MKKWLVSAFLILGAALPLVSETLPFSPTLSLDHTTSFFRHIPGQEVIFFNENVAWLGQTQKPQLFVKTRDSLAGYQQVATSVAFPVWKLGVALSYNQYGTQGIKRVERVTNAKGKQVGYFGHRFETYKVGVGYSLNDHLKLGGFLVKDNETLLTYKRDISRLDVGALWTQGPFWAGVQSRNAWSPSDEKRGVFIHTGGQISILETQLMTDFDHHRVAQNISAHKHLDITYDALLDQKQVQRVGYGLVLNFDYFAFNYVHYQFLNGFEGFSDIDQDSFTFLFRFK